MKTHTQKVNPIPYNPVGITEETLKEIIAYADYYNKVQDINSSITSNVPSHINNEEVD